MVAMTETNRSHDIVMVLGDMVRAVAAGAGLTFAGWLSVGIRPLGPVFAQALGTALPPSSESILEFAARQGGALVVLVIVLFYYRRDYRDLTAYRQARDEMLVMLVQESTKANTEMSNALRENNVVVHQAKNVLNDVLRDYVTPQRRVTDTGRQ